MHSNKMAIVIACAAVLALSACATKTRTVNVGTSADPARIKELTDERDAARAERDTAQRERDTAQTQRDAADAAQAAAEAARKAAEDVLNELRTSLEATQDALGAVTGPDTNAQQRNAARMVVGDVQRDLAAVQRNLNAQPDSAAKTAADEALAAVDTALARVVEVLAANPASGSGGGGGDISFANMHTTLDRAQNALDDAQEKLTAALAANPTGAIRTALSQAQATLTVAQLSLIPQLRSELAAARQPPPPPPEPPPPTAAETALREAQTALTEAQAATAAARTALAAAQVALEKVETDFQATAAAWTGDTTDTQKTTAREAAQMARQTAQTALAAAQTAFVNARNAERMAVAPLATAAAAALAAATTDDQRTQANAGGAAATAAETAALAWTATRIAADPGLAEPPRILTVVPAGPVGSRTPFTARVSLVPREPTDISGCTVNMRCRNPDALDLAPDAVAYAAGKTLLSPDATGDGDKFPLRMIAMRGDIRHSYEGASNDAGGARPKVAVVQRGTNRRGGAIPGGITAFQRHYRNPVMGTIQLTPDGMVFETGGEGAVMSLFKHDLDRSSSRGRDGLNSPGNWGTTGTVDGNTVVSDDCAGNYPSFCYDFNRSDLQVSWGAPYADPDGEPNYYWASRYGLAGNQPQPDPEDSDGRRLAAHGALGDLRMWLSNHGGLDTGAMADDASDDAERYLSYAAYGLFLYTDYIDEYPRPGLIEGFHFGYDAYQDEAGSMTTDVTNSIEATFEGRTMGMILHPRTLSVATESAPHIGHFTRLRGDVTFYACIGGAGCTGTGIPTAANKIRGGIGNLEALEDGIWQKYTYLRNSRADDATYEGFAIRLAEGDIAADGSYSGDTDTHGNIDGAWNQGEYNGRLYGPADKLETAGWWRLETDSTHQQRHVTAFGSFGACQAEHCRVPAPSN